MKAPLGQLEMIEVPGKTNPAEMGSHVKAADGLPILRFRLCL